MKKEEILEEIDDLINNAKEIYKSKTLEDFGQVINQSGEIEVLDIISLIEEFKEDIESKA